MRRVFAVLAIGGALALAPAAAQAAPSSTAGAFVLTATSPGGNYAPTFTGNGLLGVRVPPSGPGLRAGHRPRAVRAGRLLRPASGSPVDTCSSAPTSPPGRR